jgi:hypothetical protein
MEYIIIKRTKFEGSNISDMLNIQKTAKSLEEALKYTTALKMLENDKRVEFNVLINIAPPRLPSTIKLYESKSIEGLLLDHREVKPLAVNDWALIQNKLIGIKNN